MTAVGSGAGIFSNELEERLTPRIIRITKDLIPEHLQFFNGDGADGVCHGFAPLFVEVLKIKFFRMAYIYFPSVEFDWLKDFESSTSNAKIVCWTFHLKKHWLLLNCRACPGASIRSGNWLSGFAAMDRQRASRVRR